MPEIHAIKSTQGSISDGFWTRYIERVRDVVVPYQWQALNDLIQDAEPSHAIENFRIAAGERDGTFHGMVFQDSDVAKWLEAVAYLLERQDDEKLEHQADETIALIGRAQQADGYLNTYFTCKEPDGRWTNLCECHELYCAGHMIEAAVAYYQATGKRALLEIMCRFIDHVIEVFGHGSNQIAGYDGHPEIELALMRLYDVTGDPRHLALCRFFVDERGRQPHFYDREWARRGKTHHDFGQGPQSFMLEDKEYSQAHRLVYEQDKAVGHAVRFAYLLTGMAHLARDSDDAALQTACERLWDNMACRQMYVTGGIGAQAEQEAFTTDYDLPNDTVYAETCAAIGLVFFARQMLINQPHRKYADAMERALYNNVLAGMALDGKHFFYVNPLEVVPEAVKSNAIYSHITPVRQGWFTCACCPPNLARLLASLDRYVLTEHADTAYVHLYIGGRYTARLGEHELKFEMTSGLPWAGQVSLAIDSSIEAGLALRVPAWAEEVDIQVNGEAWRARVESNGYAVIRRSWQVGDQVELTFAMPARRVYPRSALRHDVGCVAIQRGPLVYCIEQVDNGAGLHRLSLPETAELETQSGEGLFDDMTLIGAAGRREENPEATGEALYRFDRAPEWADQRITFIPYFAWANRGENEMRVWVRCG